MRVMLGVVVLAILSASTSGAVTVVADYGGNFTTPTPATGWKYMWNPSGVPLFSSGVTGNSANYVSLPYNSTGGAYETQASGLLPLPSPGGYLSVAHSYVTLGQNDANGPHYAIIAYTFTNAQVAADGPNLVFHTYNFSMPNDPSMGNVDVEVFKNNTLLFSNEPGGFPPGYTFSSDPTSFGPDFPMGPVAGGDTLYIALGDPGSYSGQQIGVGFTLGLSPTPEPVSLSFLAFAPLMLVRRRNPIKG